MCSCTAQIIRLETSHRDSLKLVCHIWEEIKLCIHSVTDRFIPSFHGCANQTFKPCVLKWSGAIWFAVDQKQWSWGWYGPGWTFVRRIYTIWCLSLQRGHSPDSTDLTQSQRSLSHMGNGLCMLMWLWHFSACIMHTAETPGEIKEHYRYQDKWHSVSLFSRVIGGGLFPNVLHLVSEEEETAFLPCTQMNKNFHRNLLKHL